MRSKKELQASLDAKLKELDELKAAWTAEEREPNDEEGAKLESLSSDIEADRKAIRTRELILKAEGARSELNASNPGSDPAPAGLNAPRKDEPESTAGSYARVALPRGVRARRNLSAFKPELFGGDHHAASRAAYLSGLWFGGYVLGSESMRDKLSRIAPGYENDIPSYLTQTGTEVNKGGMFVPHELDTAITDVREMYGVMRREADMKTMTSDTLDLFERKDAQTTYWIGETQTEAESVTRTSDAGWGRVRLVTKKLFALTQIAQELIEDAVIDMINEVSFNLGYALSKAEDDAALVGDGTQDYGGIRGLQTLIPAGSIVTATAGDDTYGELLALEFESAVGKLAGPAHPNAKWYISRPGWAASMVRLANAQGGSTATELRGALVQTFMGYPVVTTESLPTALTTLASVNAIFFGDMRMVCKFGNRTGIQIMTNDQGDSFWRREMVGVKAKERLDIGFIGLGDATTAGGMVAIKMGTA